MGFANDVPDSKHEEKENSTITQAGAKNSPRMLP